MRVLLCLVVATLSAAVLYGRAESADVVVVVSAQSTIQELAVDDVADIFLGRANRLPNGDAVFPIDQLEGSMTRDAFYSTFAAKSAAQVKAHWAKLIFTGRGQPPPTAPDAREIKRRLSLNPHAISYLERAQVDATVRILLP